jgi:hypothetical protein
MLLPEVLLQLVAATPSEIIANQTQVDFVHFSLMSCNALRLCVLFVALIAGK